MPVPRALGRTAAGRTNRSLATPRQSDGSYAINTPANDSNLAATIVLPTPALALASNTKHIHPRLSDDRLHPMAALTATAHLPRAVLSPSRGFPSRPLGAQTERVHAGRREDSSTTRHTIVEGEAPARIPAHIRVQQETNNQIESSSSSHLHSSPKHHSVASTIAAAISDVNHSVEVQPLDKFFPSTLTNFGEGSGVAGTRGQRWVPKKGVIDFLSRLHQVSSSSDPGDNSVVSSPKNGWVPDELNGHSSISPSHFKSKVDLTFNNIRPETPGSKLHLPPSSRAVKQVTRPPPPGEALAKQNHERDLKEVRKAMKKLAAAAKSLNLRTWFDGVEDAKGHTPLPLNTFLTKVLPKLNIHLSEPQEKLLVKLTYDTVDQLDFLTLMPKFLGENDHFHQSEMTPYLEYWKDLPLPPNKDACAPEPTAIHTLQQLKDKIETRGINAFLAGMGFSSRSPLPRQRFAESIRRLNIHLPDDEMTKLLQVLDPHQTNSIDYKQFFRLAELPQHQLGNHHRVYKGLKSQLQQMNVAELNKSHEESKDNNVGDQSLTASILDHTPTFQSFLTQKSHAPSDLPRQPSVNNTATASSSPPPSIVPELNLPLSVRMVPPLFRSVQTARTAPIPTYSPPNASESLSARSGYEYSVQFPRAPPTRFQLTHAPLHTPISSTGGIGRPISAATRVKVETQRASLKLPQLQTMDFGQQSFQRQIQARTTYPLPGAPSAFYSSEAERFTPREISLKQLQDGDRARQQARLQLRFHRMDMDEQRVLARYESDELNTQAKAAKSIVDKIQQKRQYMTSLQQNYTQHVAGKRIVHAAAPEAELIAQGYVASDPVSSQDSAGRTTITTMTSS